MWVSYQPRNECFLWWRLRIEPIWKLTLGCATEAHSGKSEFFDLSNNRPSELQVPILLLRSAVTEGATTFPASGAPSLIVVNAGIMTVSDRSKNRVAPLMTLE